MSGFSGRIENHVELALGRLLEQDKGKPNLVALLSAFVRPMQTLEDEADKVETLRGLDDAAGVWLDRLGAVVGQPRNAFDDEDYRLHIRARLLVNRSSGTPEELLAIVRMLSPDSPALELFEYFPAAFDLVLGGVTSLDEARLFFSMLDEARAVGVRGGLVSFSAASPFIVGSSTVVAVGGTGAGVAGVLSP